MCVCVCVCVCREGESKEEVSSAECQIILKKNRHIIALQGCVSFGSTGGGSALPRGLPPPQAITERRAEFSSFPAAACVARGRV